MVPRSVFFRLLLVVVSVTGLLVHSSAAATITVDESAAGVGAVDVDTTDGLCSIREAIANANADNTSGSSECTAGSGADTIVLPSSATFTLSDAAVIDGGTCGSFSCGNAGLPFITSSITIEGNGSTIERDSSLTCNLNGTAADEEFRILLVRSGSLVLEGTTVSNGCADGDWDFGGGIDNLGSLTVRNSTLSGNQAGPGGAIHVGGATLIESSTLSANSAQFGGVIWASIHDFTIRNSTLSGNSASARGGALYQSTSDAILENVTFADNTAPTAGGIFNNNGSDTVKNVIFSSSVCANGSTAGTWSASGSNFDSGTTCSTLFGSNFTPSATLNLGALADNGGTTETRALGSGSDAIDAVAPADCSLATDQRGLSRPQGTNCDAGSFEVLVALSSPATINVDEISAGVGAVEEDPHDGLCSIREAIDNANNTSTGAVHFDCEQGYPSGADTIVLPASATFTLTDAAVLNDVNWGNTGLPHITSTITIQGNGSTIERDSTLAACDTNLPLAATEFRLIAAISGSLTLERTTLRNGCASNGVGASRVGGAVFYQTGFTVRESTFSGNQAEVGGAVAGGGSATALVERSAITGNSATGVGGGFNVATGSLTVRNSTLSGNSAVNGGGVRVNLDATVTLENVTFSGNTASSQGGGIFNDEGTVNAKNTIFDGSSCSDFFGGATWNAEGANFDSGTTCSTEFGSNFSANATLDLGPLADNGGPTQTHALGASSAAIDAVGAADCTQYGSATAITTDQRGETRPLDGDGDSTSLCDAGAFEVAPLSIGDVTQAEGNTGSSTFSFTVSRGTATLGDATVQVDTADVSAIAGSDYTAIAGQTATIADGATSTTVDVTVAGDTVYELSETFNVNLSNATNGVLVDSSGLGTITNDDAAPVFSIGDVTLAEGDTGTTAFTFTIAKTGATEVTATVDAASSDGTATVADSDYNALPLTTVSFAPAEVGKTVTVNVNGDLVAENDETFNINLSNATQATIGDNLGVGLITNDDTAGVTVSKATATTSETGTTDSFTYVLDTEPSADVTLTVTAGDTTEGLLTDADETDQASVTLTFTAANWNAPQTVTVTGQDDALTDGNQTYNVTTTTASGDPLWQGLTVASVAVTNNDDDVPSVAVTPTSGLITNEIGGTDSFTVVLTSQPTADVTIGLSSDNTAEGVVSPSTLTFTSANWDTPQIVTVTGVDDVLADGDQPYTIVTGDAVSADPGYNGALVSDVTVTNTDDETSANDGDGDGVDNATEDGGPNGGDGNDDGIPDSTQPNVATFPAANGNGFITVVSTCELRDVQGVLKETLEPTLVLFPYALVEFRMPCATADMTVLFHAGDGWDPEIGYWKYGPETPGQMLTTKWYQLPGVVFDTTMVGGMTVARANFTLNDGQLGDDTGVDGEIVDQGGPGAPGPVDAVPTASEWMLMLLAMLLATIGFWKLR